jgi:probable F420-dependent oxidoreductase
VNLGAVGIWTGQLDFVPAPVVRDTVARLEELGYGAIWFGENIGREPIAQAGLVLAATKHLTVATGIMNIWARDPLATTAAQLTLAEAHPDRFLLGLGTSHARLVEGERGHHYDQPVAKMRTYLDAMDQATQRYRAFQPASAPRVLAALGPRMLTLAAERTDGAHTYFVPPEHTAQARTVLGDDKVLAVEQAVVLETDPTHARAIARRHTRRYLPLPNYTNNLLRLGFHPADFDHEGSDHLVDTIVAWGSIDNITQRIHNHRAAGADHVCIQVITDETRQLPYETWRLLAESLCRP